MSGIGHSGAGSRPLETRPACICSIAATVAESLHESLVHQCHNPSETLPSGFFTFPCFVPRRDRVPIPATEQGALMLMSSKPFGSFRTVTGRLGIPFSDRILHHSLHAGYTQSADSPPFDLSDHTGESIVPVVPGDPRRSSDSPPSHDGRGSVPAPVSGPPTEGVVASDITASSPYRRKVCLEVGSIAIWELRRGSLHDNSRKAAPRRRGSVEAPPVVGFSIGKVGGD